MLRSEGLLVIEDSVTLQRTFETCTKVDSDERLECDPDMASLASFVAGRRWSANHDQRHSVHTVTDEKK
jgi:hypothetical protein